MKKLLSLICAVSMAVSLIAMPKANALVYEGYPYVYADFETENDISDITEQFNENTAVWQAGGAEGTFGSAKVTQTKDYGEVRFGIPNGGDFIGRTFKIATWVKLDTEICTLKEGHEQLKFILRAPTQMGSEVKEGYKLIDAKATGLNQGNWVYAEAIVHNWDGTMDNGEALKEHSVSGYSVGVRVGNANGQEITKALQTGTKLVYYLDDFVVEPVETPYVPVTDELPVSYRKEFLDFSDASALNGAPYNISSNWNQDAKRDTGAGHDGKAGFLKWKESGHNTSNADTSFTKRVFQYNKLYKISLYAKADNDATVGKSMQLILNRSGRLDKTEDTGAFYQGGSYQNLKIAQSLTKDWTKYEIYMMRQEKSFDEKPLTMIMRVGSGNAKAMEYSVDDFCIEEFYAPANGDFEWKKADIPATAVTGHTDESASYGAFYAWNEQGVSVTPSAPATDSKGKQSAKITTTEEGGTISQGVYFENGKEYPISFWAKGEGASVGKEIKIKLDRKVTTVNTADKYAITDTEYLGTGLVLTDEWKLYTVTYTPNFAKPSDTTNIGPRQPILSFEVDGGAKDLTYYLDDVSFRSVEGESYNLPYVTDFVVDSTNVETSTATLSYTYQSDLGWEEAGSVLRVMKKASNGKWVSLGQQKLEGGTASYTISEGLANAQLRYDILPIGLKNGKAVGGAIYSIEATTPVKKQLVVTSSLSDFNAVSSSVTGTVSVENNKVDGSNVELFLGIVLYDAEDEVVAIQTKPLDVANMTNASETLTVSTVDVPGKPVIKKAKAFVWGGTDMVNTDMLSFAPMIEKVK